MKVYLTVGSRQIGFVVLGNDLMFILMGVIVMWNTIYDGEIFLYIYICFREICKYTSLFGIVTENSSFCIMVVVYCNWSNGKFEHPILQFSFFLYICVFEKIWNFTSPLENHHRGFVVLRNACLFIEMGVFDISNNLYYGEIFLYIQGVSKRALQLWKRIEIYTEDIHNVLNCQNVAKHAEFYLG